MKVVRLTRDEVPITDTWLLRNFNEVMDRFHSGSPEAGPEWKSITAKLRKPDGSFPEWVVAELSMGGRQLTAIEITEVEP
jgi:hypothetical protein